MTWVKRSEALRGLFLFGGLDRSKEEECDELVRFEPTAEATKAPASPEPLF